MVLLVEGDEPLVRLAAWFLIEAGYDVDQVAHPDHAVDYVRAAPPHVVVLNTPAADADRADCIGRLRELAPAAGYIDISPRAWPDVPAETGADRYLRLPFHADTFVETVADLARA